MNEKCDSLDNQDSCSGVIRISMGWVIPLFLFNDVAENKSQKKTNLTKQILTFFNISSEDNEDNFY